jgi:hypothetical protein
LQVINLTIAIFFNYCQSISFDLSNRSSPK